MAWLAFRKWGRFRATTRRNVGVGRTPSYITVEFCKVAYRRGLLNHCTRCTKLWQLEAGRKSTGRRQVLRWFGKTASVGADVNVTSRGWLFQRRLLATRNCRFVQETILFLLLQYVVHIAYKYNFKKYQYNQNVKSAFLKAALKFTNCM